VKQAYNPNIQEADGEDLEFEANLDYTVRPFLKSNRKRDLLTPRTTKPECAVPVK
jgi:hypothetical protein